MRGEFLKDFEKTSRGEEAANDWASCYTLEMVILVKGEGRKPEQGGLCRTRTIPSLWGLRPDLSLFNGLFLRSKDGNNIRNMA